LPGRMPGMMRRAYQSDLSDAEWALIEPHIPALRTGGRPRLRPLREILDAVFYVVRGGCTWRLLPHDDFPPRKTVYHYFRLWRIETALGSACTRRCARGGRAFASAERPAT
jgi:putative transposase